MHRPSPSCNHTKWQVSPPIGSQNNVIGQRLLGSTPTLSDGSANRHPEETLGSDKPYDFDSKEILITLYEQQRAGSGPALESVVVDTLSNEGAEPIRCFQP